MWIFVDIVIVEIRVGHQENDGPHKLQYLSFATRCQPNITHWAFKRSVQDVLCNAHVFFVFAKLVQYYNSRVFLTFYRSTLCKLNNITKRFKSSSGILI